MRTMAWGFRRELEETATPLRLQPIVQSLCAANAVLLRGGVKTGTAPLPSREALTGDRRPAARRALPVAFGTPDVSEEGWSTTLAVSSIPRSPGSKSKFGSLSVRLRARMRGAVPGVRSAGCRRHA